MQTCSIQTRPIQKCGRVDELADTFNRDKKIVTRESEYEFKTKTINYIKLIISYLSPAVNTKGAHASACDK